MYHCVESIFLTYEHCTHYGVPHITVVMYTPHCGKHRVSAPIFSVAGTCTCMVEVKEHFQITGLALRGLAPTHWRSSIFSLLKVFEDFPPGLVKCTLVIMT